MRLLLLLSALLLGFTVAPARAQTVHLSLPDTTVQLGDDVLVPVRADLSLTGLDVTAFRLVLTYSGEGATPLEVVTVGGLANGMSVSSKISLSERTIRVAGAGTTALQGEGVLFYVRFRADAAGRTLYLGFDAAQSLLNEGTPALSFQDGRITVPSQPQVVLPSEERVLLVGESTTYGAWGGAAPYTYATSDASVATIDAEGVLTAHSVGRVRVGATDANGVVSQNEGQVEVRGYAITLPDTSARLGATLDLPLYSTSLAGLNVMSGSVTVHYNAHLVSVEGVVTEGTQLAGSSVQVRPSANGSTGKAQIAFALASPLVTSSGAPLLKLRLRTDPNRSGSTALSLEDPLVNEATRGIVRRNGSVRVDSPPVLSLSPGSLELLAGVRATLTSSTATGTLTWTVDDPAVATVDAAGTVTGVRSGTTTVRAVDADGAIGSASLVVFGARVAVGDGEGRPGSEAFVPVRLLAPTEGVRSMEAVIPAIGGGAVLVADSVVALAQGWLFTSRVRLDGSLAVAGAGPALSGAERDLFAVRVPLDATLGDQTRTVVIRDVLLNQGRPTVQLASGMLTVFSQNRPPTRIGVLPDLSLAEDFAAFNAVNIDTLFSDPDGDALSYRIALSPNAPFTASLAEGILRLTPVTHAFGSGWVDLTALDPEGAETTARLSVSVTPVNDPPTAPLLQRPEESVRLDVTAGSDAPVIVEWTAATDADEDPLVYRVQLSVPADFSTLLLDAPTGSALSYQTTSGTLDGLLSSANLAVGDSLIVHYRVLVSDGSTERASGVRAVRMRRMAPSAATCINVGVATGWNLVSIPVQHETMDPSLAFAGTTNHFAYVSRYESVSQMSLGRGYWLKSEADQTYRLCGEPAAAQTVDLAIGWNLVGPFHESVATSAITLGGGAVLGSDFFGYTSRYNPATTLLPGKGYWIKANSAGTMTFGNAPGQGAPASRAVAAESALAEADPSWLQLSIEDTDRRKATLYLTSAATGRFDLPPVPPAGLFDVRFDTDRSVEMEEGDHTLVIRAATYPITLRVSNLDNRSLTVRDASGAGLVMSRLADGEAIVVPAPVEALTVTVGEADLPSDYALEGNFPNPFSGTTSIRYTLPQPAHVSVSVYNLYGEQVSVLEDRERPAGTHDVSFNAGHLASGVYVVRIRAGTFQMSRKIIITR